MAGAGQRHLGQGVAEGAEGVVERGGGAVGIAPVEPSRLPGPLPEGINPPLVLTIQADGVTNFDLPVAICFPNLEGGEPGDVNSLMAFDHDSFVIFSKSFGLIYMMAFFVGAIVWAYWPSRKKRFDKAAEAILHDEDGPCR